MTIKDIKSENFESDVLNSDKPAMLVFWAPWCGHCHNYKALLETMEVDPGSPDITVCRVNTDENTIFTTDMKISGIPTTCFYKDGALIDRRCGVLTKQDILNIFNM